MGATMIGLHQFILAAIAFGCAAIWTIGFWLTSDYLRAKARLLRARQTRKNPEEFSRQTTAYRLWKYGISLCILVSFLASLWFVSNEHLKLSLESFEDGLYPANDPDPQLACNKTYPLQDKTVALYLGNSRISVPEAMFPWPVLKAQDLRYRKPIITLEKDKIGRIAIDLDVRSKDGRLIARIERNHFVLNANNLMVKHRPDRSTLIVIDQDGNEVLNLRYLNPHSIHLLGQFYVYGQNEPVVFTEEWQSLGKTLYFSGVCQSYSSDKAMMFFTSGDGSGSHEYDGPGGTRLTP